MKPVKAYMILTSVRGDGLLQPLVYYAKASAERAARVYYDNAPVVPVKIIEVCERCAELEEMDQDNN